VIQMKHMKLIEKIKISWNNLISAKNFFDK